MEVDPECPDLPSSKNQQSTSTAQRPLTCHSTPEIKRESAGGINLTFSLSLGIIGHTPHAILLTSCARKRGAKWSKMYTSGLECRGQRSNPETLDQRHHPVWVCLETLPPLRWDGCARSPSEELPADWCRLLPVASKCTARHCPWRLPPVGQTNNTQAG